MKIASKLLFLSGTLGLIVPCVFGRMPQATSAASAARGVSRTTKAVNYRRAGGAVKVDFQGTELMQQASGEAKVQNKGSRVEIDVGRFPRRTGHQLG